MKKSLVCQDPRWLCPNRATVVQGINPLYTGRLFHCYMLDKSICHFRGFESISSLLFYIDGKILLAKTVDSDQIPHYVASDLGLHCLPMTLLQVSRWVKHWPVKPADQI